MDKGAKVRCIQVEHKRTSLRYKGVKYDPYIGNIPKGRSTYSTTRGARVKGASGGEISAIGWIYVQHVRYRRTRVEGMGQGSRVWNKGSGIVTEREEKRNRWGSTIFVTD